MNEPIAVSTEKPEKKRRPRMMRGGEFTEEFWDLVIRSSSGCWEWTGSKNEQGYGRIQVDNKRLSVHRAIYAKFCAPIPDGLFVCHHCDNPACCRPDHLFLGTQKANIEDMVRKGRAATGLRNGTHTKPESRARGNRNGTRTKPESRARGERQGQAKLTEEKIRELRAEYVPYKNGFCRLSKKHGISHGVIRDIIRRLTWKHVV